MTLTDIVKYGENSKQNINLNIGLFGHTQFLKIGVIESQEICNMNISKIPKFVINLERRPDRLKHIQKEMDYMDWDYEIFKAIDLNNHGGCTLSHTNIIKIAKERGYDSVMVIEDDCIFLPYSKDLIHKIETESGDFEFGIINLAPTLNRKVNRSKEYPLFLDITNLPPKLEHERGVFATNMMIYHKSIYDNVLELEQPEKLGYYAIDDYIYQFILPIKQSYSPILPIAPQISSWSDVSQGQYNNFYTQTYNWNLYSPCKIPSGYLQGTLVQELKDNKQHNEFTYVS
jgi:GR25 family glycosyltransferase involved in LPS biosynthesis